MPLRAGASIVDISPPAGVELAGYPYAPRPNTGIHDPLYASCLFLDDGKTLIALVAMDLVMLSKRYVQEIREQASRLTGIPERNMMMTCSHTHSGPWASGRLDREAVEQKLQPDANYIGSLKDKLVHLIEAAYRNTREAIIGVGKGYVGKEQGIGGNRRNPKGPADPELGVIGVRDVGGHWMAALVKYALHPTVIHADSTVVTADYPAYLRSYLAHIKPEMRLLFMQGTSGDQSTRYFRQGQTFEEAERIGSVIGAEADRVLNTLAFSPEATLNSLSAEVHLELKTLPTRRQGEEWVRETRRRYEALVSKHASYTEVQTAYLHWLGADATLGYIMVHERGERLDLEVDELPAEVQVMRIGDALLVGLPGELFVEFGLAIRDRSPLMARGAPLKHTFVIELANGCLPGYACTAEAYAQGGYESGASLLTETAGATMVKTALNLIGQACES